MWAIFAALLGVVNLVGMALAVRRGDVKLLRGTTESIYRDAQPTEFWAIIGFRLLISIVLLAMTISGWN
jgi:hypothetical protein